MKISNNHIIRLANKQFVNSLIIKHLLHHQKLIDYQLVTNVFTCNTLFVRVLLLWRIEKVLSILRENILCDFAVKKLKPQSFFVDFNYCSYIKLLKNIIIPKCKHRLTLI
jgi:hypothetical protein